MVHKAGEAIRGPTGSLISSQTRDHCCLAWVKLNWAEIFEVGVIIAISRDVQEDNPRVVIKYMEVLRAFLMPVVHAFLKGGPEVHTKWQRASVMHLTRDRVNGSPTTLKRLCGRSLNEVIQEVCSILLRKHPFPFRTQQLKTAMRGTGRTGVIARRIAVLTSYRQKADS